MKFLYCGHLLCRFNMEINHFFLKCANSSDFILQTSLISQGLVESSVQWASASTEGQRPKGSPLTKSAYLSRLCCLHVTTTLQGKEIWSAFPLPSYSKGCSRQIIEREWTLGHSFPWFPNLLINSLNTSSLNKPEHLLGKLPWSGSLLPFPSFKILT